MRLARYTPNAVYIPGRFMVVADALSRGNFSENSDGDEDLERDIHCYVLEEFGNIQISEHQFNRLYKEQMKDTIISKVIECTLKGWGEEELSSLADYFPSRGDLSIFNGILVYRSRLVIPESMRLEMLSRIHEGHFSLKCLAGYTRVISVWINVGKVPNCSYDDREFLET